MEKKTVITIISSAVAVGLLGFAIYKYRQNKKQEENIQDGEVIEEEIPSEESGELIGGGGGGSYVEQGAGGNQTENSSVGGVIGKGSTYPPGYTGYSRTNPRPTGYGYSSRTGSTTRTTRPTTTSGYGTTRPTGYYFFTRRLKSEDIL